MKIGFIKKLSNNRDAIIVAVFMVIVFSYIMTIGHTDLPQHADAAQRLLKEGHLFSNNFLLFFLINLFSGFSGNLRLIQFVLVLLISVSNTAKYIIVKESFRQVCKNDRLACLSSAALLFVYIIPVLFFLKIIGFYSHEDTMYLGYYVPNVWHNSTILCMMPFAISSYFLSVKQFETFDRTRNRLIALLVVLGTLIKPSFFFIYGIAFPIVIFSRYRFQKEFFWSLLPILCGCICVLYEYVSIYVFQVVEEGGVLVEILPLFTLDFWRPRWLYLLASMALPILFVLAYWKEIWRQKEFWFVLVMLVVALGISFCCHETGPREGDGNFFWQAIVAMWFAYYYILVTILKCDRSPGSLKIYRKRLFVSLYILHVMMGCWYLGRFIVTQNYK